MSIRSQADIVAKIEQIKEEDFFGFKVGDLVCYLDYEHAKSYLKPETTSEEWKPFPSDKESILKQMEDYMDFAWEKANNRRGISAGRSLAHYSIWVWMIGDENLFGDLEEYQFYGKDNLREICDNYGWDADIWDDGIRANS